MAATTRSLFYSLAAFAVFVAHAQYTLPQYVPLELLDPQKTGNFIALGPFELRPAFSTGITFDDNAHGSAGVKQPDFIWNFSPSFDLSYGGPIAAGRKMLQIAYAPNGEVFMHDSRYNTFNFGQFSGSLFWPFSKLNLQLQQSYNNSTLTAMQTGTRVNQDSIATTLNATYSATERTSLSSNLRYSKSGFGSNSGLIGSQDMGNDNWVNYRLTEKSSAGIGFSIGEQLPNSQPGQIYKRLLFNYGYTISEKLTAGFSVGSEWRQYQTNYPSSLGFMFSLNGSWRMTERSSLSLSASRGDSSSALAGNQNSTGTDFSLGLTQGLTEKLSASLTAGYGINDYRTLSSGSSVRSDNNFLLNASLNYMIDAHLSCGLVYGFRKNNSSAQFGFDNNRIGFTVSWRL
ncbi:MAG: outer membrane beta-barrel protein [Verrucomicrobiota bacterium]